MEPTDWKSLARLRKAIKIARRIQDLTPDASASSIALLPDVVKVQVARSMGMTASAAVWEMVAILVEEL